MERLSGLDAVFLAIEDHNTPMNIGSVAIFEGPAPDPEAISQYLTSRIVTIERCRQRLADPLGPLVRSIWIDDLHFKPDAHLHRISLAEPSTNALNDFVSQILATPLDRRHPLWHVWIVDGLPEHRWAIIAIAHHCLVDGIAGNDLLSAVLSAEPKTATPCASADEPSTAALIRFTVRSILDSWSAHGRALWRILMHPQSSWGRARLIARAAKGLWWRQPHVSTSLVGPISAGRRWTHLRIPSTTIQTIHNEFEGTVNDIVLTAVTKGFRDLLIARGESISERTLTAMVPVSLRHSFERAGTGNRVANVHARLRLDIDNPIVRLEMIRHQMDNLKHSHDTQATGLVMNIGNFVPRLLADRMSRMIVRRQRSVETVITNVPGPQEPIYLEGHRLLEAYPIAPIAGHVRLCVAVWSYCGDLYFGITADQKSVPDIEILARGIVDGFAGLTTRT